MKDLNKTNTPNEKCSQHILILNEDNETFHIRIFDLISFIRKIFTEDEINNSS